MPGRFTGIIAAGGTALTVLLSACGDPTSSAPPDDELVRWQVPGQMRSAPIVSDSFVVAVFFDGLTALRRTTGDIVWTRADLQGGMTNTSLARSGDVVLFTDGSALYGIDARDGRSRWEHRAVGLGTGAYTPAVSGDTVFVASFGDAVALDAATGNVRWRAENVGHVLYPPSLSGDVVVYHAMEPSGSLPLAQSAGTLVALDRRTGIERWRFPIPRQSTDSSDTVGDHMETARFLFSPYPGRVMALRSSTGEILWNSEETPPGNVSWFAPVEFAGQAVFLRTDGILEARSPADGSVAWRVGTLGLGAALSHGPLPCGIFLCHTAGAIRVLTSSGEVVWSSRDAFGSSITFLSGPAVDADGVLYANAIIDARDIALLAIRPPVPLGPTP